MKKIINILIAACTLLAISIDTAYASQNRRGRSRSTTTSTQTNTRYQRQDKNRSQRTTTRRNSSSRRKKQLQPNTTKQEARTAIVNTKKTVADTKKLEEKVKQVQTATTPQEKQKAQEDVSILANRLMTDLTQRSLWSDIYTGYEKKEIDKAKLNVEKLAPIRIKIAEELSKKQAALAQVTSKGYLWNAAMPGKEEAYNKLYLEVTKYKNQLSRIDEALRSQKIIAGEEWSKAYYALLGAGAIGTVVLGADFALQKGAGTLAAASKAAQLARATSTGIASSASWVKESVPSPTGAIVAGMGALSTLSMLSNGLSVAKTGYEVSKAAYEYAIRSAVKENPKASKKEINAATQKERIEYEQAKAKFEDAGQKYQTALKQEQAKKK